MNSQNSLK